VKSYYERNRDRVLAKAKARYLEKVGGRLTYTRGVERAGTHRASKKPTQRELGWAAGFLEGEGTFFAGRRSHVKVAAVQVEREPVARCLELFGGGLKQRPAQGSLPNQQPQWIWSAHGSRARGVMLTLYSLMSPKRQGQIRKALAA